MAKTKDYPIGFKVPLQVTAGKPVMIIYGQPDKVSLRQGVPYSSASCKRLLSDLHTIGKIPTSEMQQYCIMHEHRLEYTGDQMFLAANHAKSAIPVSSTAASYKTFKTELILEEGYLYVDHLKYLLSVIKPALIIAADKWAVYFLLGNDIKHKKIIKSENGVTGVWRGSHLQLGEFYEADWEHVVMPIMAVSELFKTNADWHTHRLDMSRAGRIYTSYREHDLQRSITREEQFLTAAEFTPDEFYARTMDFLGMLALQLVQCPEGQEVRLSVDIEHRKKPVFIDCIGIAINSVEAICIPLYTKQGKAYFTESQEVEVMLGLKYVLEHPKAAIIGQNFNYDGFWLRENFCIHVVAKYDTTTLHHTLFPALEKNLGFLSSMYCVHHRYWKHEIKSEDERLETDAARWAYNCSDTTRTYEICATLLAQTELLAKAAPKQYAAAKFQYQDLYPVVRKVGDRGVIVDQRARGKVHAELYQAIQKLETIWQTATEGLYSSTSSAQIAYFLYTDLGLTPPKVSKESKSGLPTSEEAIIALLEDHIILKPLLQVLLDLRSLRVFLKTFVEAKVSYDGKLRTQYNIDGTDTFRFSSKKLPDETGMNLQNVPKGGETLSGIPLPNVRSLIIPPEGYGMFDTDLDSADLRIVVAESGCREMQHWLDTKQKPYIMVAREYSKDPTVDKHHKLYKLFKAFCHGCLTADHEVLTPNGWVAISEKPSELAQWNPETWGITFALSSNWIDKEASELVAIEGQAFSQLVTPDHKLMGTTDKPDQLREYTAETLPKSARLPYAGKYHSGKVSLNAAQVVLLAALQADGHISYTDSTGGSTVVWHFARPRKIARLKEALTNLGLEYTETVTNYLTSGGNQTTKLATKLPPDYPVTASMKQFDYWILGFTQETLMLLADEVLRWDGYEATNAHNRKEFCTTNKLTAEVVNTLFQLTGHGSRLTKRVRDETRQTLYTVSRNSRRFHNLASGTVTKVQAAKGTRVYCPTVPTGYFLVRRNGIISVTGNSNYLGSAAGLAKRLGLLVHEAEIIQAWYFKKFPEIKAWHTRIKSQVDGRGWVENCFGYRYVFYDRNRFTLYQQACAWIPQSTVACLVNRAMVSITNEVNPADLSVLLQVHDSLAGIYRLDLPNPKELLRKHMEVPLPYAGRNIIVPADAALSAKSWGECE